MSHVNRSLYKIAGIGAVACLGMFTATTLKLQSNAKHSPFFIESLGILRDHEGAKMLLGEPISDGYISMWNDDSQENVVRFSVNVKGSKEHGKMYIWASKEDTSRIQLKRIELELSSDDSKRLVVKKE